MKVMLTALAAAVLLVSPAARAADVVIGDFETGFDGFVPREGSILSTSTEFGVTRGTQSLAVNRNGGGYWGLSSVNVIATSRDNFLAAKSVSFDMTLLASQLGNDGVSFSGFAQANEFVINDFGGAFVQRNFGSGLATDSLGRNGQWGGQDGTRTITWNLETYPAPPSSPGLTYKQHLINNPQIGGVVFWVPVQAGGGNVSPSATFYFDNWRLTLPDTTVAGDFGGNESSDGSFNTPDGAFNELDVEGFLLALNDQAAYLVLNPTLQPTLLTRGDFGGNESTDGSFNTPDGAFNELDVEGFLLALNDPAGYAAIQPPGLGGVSAIPEPAALALLAPMGLLISRRRR